MNDKLNSITNLINVLVTGVGGGSIGEQVCKSLLFGHHSYRLIATNTTREATRIIPADAVEVLPLASSSDYLECLIKLIKIYEIQFLIPGSEPELIKLSKNINLFEDQNTKVLINSPEIIATCTNKQHTFEFLSNNGFRVPQTTMFDPMDLGRKIEFSFPCIVKPSLGGGGSASTFLAQDHEELSFFVKYLIKYGHVPLIQEYIPDAENEYTVGVLHSPFGELLGTVVLRRQILSGLSNRLKVKNCTGKKEMGSILAVSSGISQGEIVEFEPVKKTAEAIAQKLGSIGPLNIQGRWNGSDFVPFEINPRFSGTTPMRSLAGFNEPERMINSWLGKGKNERTSQIRLGTCIRGLKEYFIPKDGGETVSSV
jgi:carbamoyl-phosphate synthase large subunit